MLAGSQGSGVRLAMEMVVAVGEAAGAESLVDISGAHIDGCLYHGEAGVDFVEALGEATVAVPTTLNVSSLDLLHPELYRGDAVTAARARHLMDLYVALGCAPTWTCAPYQLAVRPRMGDQVAWGESNAIVFANSVLGARTERYGDFLDICCAVTGKAPYAGLHTDAGRRAEVIVEVRVPDRYLDLDAFYPILGHVMGRESGPLVPVLVGLDERADEDRLKGLGAAAASSGAVGMFHAVGVTPEAPDLETAMGGAEAVRVVRAEAETMRTARSELGSSTGPLGAISVGTPHYSLTQLKRLSVLVEGKRSRVPFYVNTGRQVLAEAETAGLLTPILGFGATLVTDTCTYITPILGEVAGPVMTDSAKWAYYAPGNLGVSVVFADMESCVASAVGGVVETHPW